MDYLYVGVSLITFGLFYLCCLKLFTNKLFLHKYSFLMGSIGALIISQTVKNNYLYISCMLSSFFAFLVFFLAWRQGQ